MLFRSYILQMKFKPPPRFDRGFLVRDGLPPRRTPVGKLFPQPNVRTAGGEKRLDDVLGQGFSIVVRSPRAAGLLPALRAAPWDRLDASILVMGDDVRETAPVPALAGFDDHVFLLRPDRYVAACIPADQLARGAAQVDQLIVGTLL